MTCMVYEPDATVRQVLELAITASHGKSECESKLVAEFDNVFLAYDAILQHKPEVVFWAIDADNPDQSLSLLKKISVHHKDGFVVAMTQNADLSLAMTCMQAGARDMLTKPLTQASIFACLEQHNQVRQMQLHNEAGLGRIITVFSYKGGIGKTTLSVNLAYSLSRLTQSPVALVDLNLHLGDITTFLNINPKQTLADVARNLVRVDAAYLKSSLERCQLSNADLYVLAEPLNVEEAEEITSEQINALLTILKSAFPFVVVDTNAAFDNKTLTALDVANDVLLVSTANLPAIRSTQRVLSLFQRLGYPRHKQKLIINRYWADDAITLDDIEDTLEHPVFDVIPNNYRAIITAINRGIPLAELEQSQSIVGNFDTLAQKLIQVAGQQGQGASVVSSPTANARTPLLPSWLKLPTKK
jgi:pilus assembly protein CpaE